MIFLLIRHGVTDWNLSRRLQGREDIPLNAEGVAQAEMTGRALSGLPIKTYLSSPLARAVKTGEIAASYTGGKVIIEPDLTERDFGNLSGKIPKDIFNPVEDGSLEPLDDVSQRFMAVLKKYSGHSESIIAAVSHGGAINAVLRTVSGGKTGSGKIRLHNGGISILSYDGKCFSIIKENIPAETFREEAKKYL